MINIQLYGKDFDVKFDDVKNYDNLKEIISDSFSIDLSNYKFQYYDNVEKDKNDKNNENHNQKEIVDDEKSYKKFCKNNDKKKKSFLYVINPSFEESILEKCNFKIPTFSKNVESNNIFHEINESIGKIKDIFLKSNHFIYNQIKKYTKTITSDTLKVNYDNIKQIKNIKKKIYCNYCDEEITSTFYFKCPECLDFLICKLCEYRFQNKNHHKHDLLYIKNGNENNTNLKKGKEKERKKITLNEIEEIINKEAESLRYDDDYKVEFSLNNKVINIDFNDKEEDYEIRISIQNLGKKKINSQLRFQRYNPNQNWYKELTNCLLFENAVYRIPDIEKKEKKDYYFKINIKNKTPGKYFAIFCLKRNTYYVEGSLLALEININLRPDDYL